MDLLESLKTNKLVDILYRFVLWFLLGMVLYHSSLYMNDIEGEKLRNAIKLAASSHFTQIIGVLGMLAGGIALTVKELFLNNKHQYTFVYFLSKASSDLVLSPFNIMSFGLGWGFYLWISGKFDNQEITILGILLLPYFVIMVFLAITSLIIRAEEGEYIYTKLYSVTNKLIQRLFIYFSLIGVTIYVLFYR